MTYEQIIIIYNLNYLNVIREPKSFTFKTSKPELETDNSLLHICHNTVFKAVI